MHALIVCLGLISNGRHAQMYPNRRRAWECVSDYSVMQYVTTETRDLQTQVEATQRGRTDCSARTSRLPQWICRLATTLFPFPTSRYHELPPPFPSRLRSTRRELVFYVFRELNRRRAFVLISVIRDVVSETHAGLISLLSCGTFPLRFPHVVLQR
jgi:hypothetical protein